MEYKKFEAMLAFERRLQVNDELVFKADEQALDHYNQY